MAYQIRYHNEPLTTSTESPPPSLSILAILTECLQIPGKNTKSKLTITLLTLFPFCFLSLCADLFTTPLIIRVVSLMERLQTSTTNHSAPSNFSSIVGEILRQTCLLLGLEIASLFGFCAATLISISAAARSNATTYNLQELGLRELVSRIGRASKGHLITWIHISFITVSLVGLILILVGVMSVTMPELEIVVPVVLGIVVVILGTQGYLYLAVIWVLSLVIAVVEEDFVSQRTYEHVGSIGRAREANSIKRRLKSSVLILGFSVVSVAIALLLRFELVMALSCMCFVKVFLCLGYAVFYYEFRLKYGEQIEEEERLLLGSYYAPPSMSTTIATRTSEAATSGAVNSAFTINVTSRGDGCDEP
ncbi:hypothetical protein Syun_024994 [Stephania yunnanensis]|uniref:Transmembrane protein n=1 Tax=Stephania yunnanensis TaxID=152371 RepID=A0AAP0HUE3_9MAGN